MYKGTNAVIFVFDITKKWTFDYIKEEMEKIPPNIEVAILANCKDLEDKRVISQNEINEYLKKLKRKNVKCFETSMKNLYGLKQLHTVYYIYFNISI